MDVRAGLAIGPRTQLVMTPRMRQSLDVLQSSTIELAALLQEQLSENPFLEESAAPEAEAAAEPRADPDPCGPGGGDGGAGDWRDEDRRAEVASARRGWEDRPPAAWSVEARESWATRLLGQLRLCRGSAPDTAIAEYILGCVDSRGYLAVAPEEIAAEQGVSLERVEEVRQRLLRLDPPGIAARDLRECLRVQLEERGGADRVALELIDGGLPDLARRRFERLAERIGVSVAEVRAAAERVRSLWPHPASQLAAPPEEAVNPELVIERVDGRYEVMVSDRLLPRLRVAVPGEQLRRHRDPRTRAFVSDRLVRARWLLASLDARRRTLIAVMREILDQQADFFARGVAGLRPLTYRQLAAGLGLHESTVARAVRGKYVQTPHGVVPLRFFFAQGFASREGGEAVPAAVRDRIRELIAAEDRRRPWSDEELTRELRRSGLRIARRTVAKYRDRMRIPAAALRAGGGEGIGSEDESAARRRERWTSSPPHVISS